MAKYRIIQFKDENIKEYETNYFYVQKKSFFGKWKTIDYWSSESAAYHSLLRKSGILEQKDLNLIKEVET